MFSKSSEHLNQEDSVCLLKSLLKGNAASVLAGIRVTSTSHDTIVNKLFKTFGSDKIILNRYVKRLVLYDSQWKGHQTNGKEIPSKSLRKAFEYLQAIIRNLMYVSTDVLTSGRILIELLLLKTPQSLQIEFELSTKPRKQLRSTLK